MAKFTPPQTIKPENIEIGQSIEIHAASLATFKTYVSRYNKDRDYKARFSYAEFVGTFCKATRLADDYKPSIIS